MGVVLFLGFVALGTWQVERRAWKLALIERVEGRVHAPPSPVPSEATWPTVNAADFEYLPVNVQGSWIPGKTVLTTAVTELGAGFWVISALRQPDGTTVLVNRGFVPQDQRSRWLSDTPSTANPIPTAATDPVKITGLLRISEPGGGFLRTNDAAGGRWFSRDVAAISTALGLQRAAPFFIDAGLPAATTAAPGSSGDVDARTASASAGPWPRTGMTVIRFHNSHLVYTLTWYGLALMVVVAGWYVARYERSLASAGNRATPTTDEPHAP